MTRYDELQREAELISAELDRIGHAKGAAEQERAKLLGARLDALAEELAALDAAANGPRPGDRKPQ